MRVKGTESGALLDFFFFSPHSHPEGMNPITQERKLAQESYIICIGSSQIWNSQDLNTYLSDFKTCDLSSTPRSTKEPLQVQVPIIRDVCEHHELIPQSLVGSPYLLLSTLTCFCAIGIQTPQ